MSDYIPVFVYDRTQADVDNRTEKGFINANDLNRIDASTEAVASNIAVTVAIKKDWKISDFPRASDYQRIKENIQKIRDGFAIYSDTPQVPDRPYNTYQKWNDIERILHDVFSIYDSNKKYKIYCGESYFCGDIGIL